MITQSTRSTDHYQKPNVPIRPNRSGSSSANKNSGGAGFQHPDLQTFERKGPLTVSNARSDPAATMDAMLAKPKTNPAFLMACKRGDETAVKGFLLKKLNDETINHRDSTGRTGLSYICSDGQMSLLHMISDVPDLDMNLSDNEGNTPLMLAAQAGHAEVVAYILDRFRGTVEIDKRNQFGMTALMKASLQGRARCVKLLLSAGSNPMLRDPNRRYTSLDWARYCGRQCCIEQIEKFLKSNPKRYSNPFDSKIVAASTASARNRRTSESELGSEYLLMKHQQLSKSDSENSWLRQKLRKTLRHESKSKRDLGPLGNMTATAMMCASSAIFTNIEESPAMNPTATAGLVEQQTKRASKPLPLLVPKLEITQAPVLVSEFELLLESESKSTRNSLAKRKKSKD